MQDATSAAKRAGKTLTSGQGGQGAPGKTGPMAFADVAFGGAGQGSKGLLEAVKAPGMAGIPQIVSGTERV